MRAAWIVVTGVAVGLFCVAGDAEAQRRTNYAELVGGVAKPLGEDDYEDLVDTSPKIGLRIGWLGPGRDSRAGLELGVDFTSVDNEVDDLPAVEADVGRVRALVGARMMWRLDGGSGLFLRAGVGIDYVHAELTGTILGVSASVDGDSVGLALEAGGGIIISVSRTAYFGLQVAVPVAIHDDEADDDDDPLVLDYTGYDLDALLTLGTRF